MKYCFIDEDNEATPEEAPQEEVPSTAKKDDGYVMKLPESEKDTEREFEPNSKPFWTMRVAAGLIDVFLIFLMTFGLYQLFVRTPMNSGLRQYGNGMVEIQDQYKLKTLIEGDDSTVGHKLYENEEKYGEYTTNLVYFDEDLSLHYVVVDNENVSDALANKYVEVVTSDETYKAYQFNYRLINYGITMLALGISETVLFFFIPLINKRRATLGQLLAGTQLINSAYQVEAKWYQLFGRFLWVFLIESALPYLFLELYTMLVIPVVVFLITLTNKNRRTLHDFISRTMIIDKKTFVRLTDK